MFNSHMYRVQKEDQLNRKPANGHSLTRPVALFRQLLFIDENYNLSLESLEMDITGGNEIHLFKNTPVQ